MPPGSIQLIIILAYLVLLLGLGLFSSRLFRGTKLDYQVASHSIGPFLLLMSLFGTTMTAFALVGSTGEAYRWELASTACSPAVAGLSIHFASSWSVSRFGLWLDAMVTRRKSSSFAIAWTMTWSGCCYSRFWSAWWCLTC